MENKLPVGPVKTVTVIRLSLVVLLVVLYLEIVQVFCMPIKNPFRAQGEHNSAMGSYVTRDMWTGDSNSAFTTKKKDKVTHTCVGY